MFDQFVGQVATRGWKLALRVAAAPGAQATAKRYALQVGAAVTAVVVRKAADMAEEKIEELQDRGSLSPTAATVATGVVRATRTGVTVTAAVVGNTAATVIGGDELVRLINAVREAARDSTATAPPDLKSTADDSRAEDPNKGPLEETSLPDVTSAREAARAGDQA